ncbi:MAG TPA: hypothetical protein VKT30_00515 [Caulobacteraceae bacterium]|nr:hypothetical protein [Caulobacteraceae bacterium]
MVPIESPDQHAAFADALARVRARLEPPPPPERLWPTIAAAAFFAFAAMTFATAAILAPPAQLTPISDVRGAV